MATASSKRVRLIRAEMDLGNLRVLGLVQGVGFCLKIAMTHVLNVMYLSHSFVLSIMRDPLHLSSFAV